MSSIRGVWKHEASYGGRTVVTVQAIREDNTYETHMVFPSAGGCEQHVYHYGSVEVGDATLRLHFGSGKTKMTGCQDESKNFELRDFTEAEIDEAKTLLAQNIPFTVVDDTFTTTVKTPVGEMSIAYKRQVE